MLLLDTSIVIHIRDKPSQIDKRISQVDCVPSLSIITRVELEGGAVGDTELATRRLTLLDEMLQLFPVLDFNTDCAEIYRQIVRGTGFSRRKTLDRMIAATALANDLTLVTANPGDFEDIPGLALEVWSSN